ncbi:MAG: hypothetical protein ACP5HZ_07875 [Ferrimicrobium sp.]
MNAQSLCGTLKERATLQPLMSRLAVVMLAFEIRISNALAGGLGSLQVNGTNGVQ